MYEYLGITKNVVRCLSEQGKIRLFPINITNLHIASLDEHSAKDGYVASVDDFLALKEIIDAILSQRMV